MTLTYDLLPDPDWALWRVQSYLQTISLGRRRYHWVGDQLVWLT